VYFFANFQFSLNSDFRATDSPPFPGRKIPPASC
jgi:hypothetical protein